MGIWKYFRMWQQKHLQNDGMHSEGIDSGGKAEAVVRQKRSKNKQSRKVCVNNKYKWQTTKWNKIEIFAYYFVVVVMFIKYETRAFLRLKEEEDE